jgi:hypothetical protein
MATIIERIRAYLRGPQGQRLTRQARDQLRNPDNQRRLSQIAQRLRQRR